MRAELLEYYKAQYGAERMSCVVVAGDDLDTMQGWVEEKLAGVAGGVGARASFKSVGRPFEVSGQCGRKGWNMTGRHSS